jgi:hypothetical protein
MPGGERQGQCRQGVGEQSHAAGVDVPAPPKGEESGDEQDDASEGIHRFY